jgi:hypothetical protein
MEPIFIDLHIHTSEDPNNLNEAYDLELLKKKIEEVAEDSPYLISLTDHNTINKPVYLKAIKLFNNILLGVELHICNYDFQKPYHCHIYFNLKQIDEKVINSINVILNKLYPNKVVMENDKNIPKIEDILKKFDSYEFVLLPHGGQSHSTFDKSIGEDVQLDNALERSIYYNYFDGFTARSNAGLDATLEYFNKLGIKEFINLVTSTDNYTPKAYPNAKAKHSSPFVRTWMLASPTFNGLRLSLSESSRLKYDKKPDLWAEFITKVSLKNEHIVIDVDLTPGLNVIIGGSSSGKTLFVDSLYRKIINNFDESIYLDTPYDIENIKVTNPSGKTPHFLPQNYIIQICDQKDKEKSIDAIPILQNIFPEDADERAQIANSLSELKKQLSLLISSVKAIESIQVGLSRISKLSHLITTDVIHSNPIASILPTEKIKDLVSYSKGTFDNDMKNIDTIDMMLSQNPLMEHDKTLIIKLKNELRLAFKYSKLESNIRDIITKFKKEIDTAQTAENKETTTKRKQFEDLLDSIKKYFKYNRIFYESLNTISQISVKIPTKKIVSMGHTLYINTEFELTKSKFLEVINDMLKNDNKINAFEDITPDSLFETRFRKKSPKIEDYDIFEKRIYTDFANMNKKTYKIITKDDKDFDKLSAGWKTSVILDLILGWDKDNAPLIIDQPEDNLATYYINTGLLKAIKECKTKKQIILVTHNATIPMLGDAQNIVMCKNEEKFITIKSNPLEGAIEGINVVDLVAETTDGGKISIKKRVKKYNLKNFRGDK